MFCIEYALGVNDGDIPIRLLMEYQTIVGRLHYLSGIPVPTLLLLSFIMKNVSCTARLDFPDMQ